MRADAVLVACAGALALFAAGCRKKIEDRAGTPPPGALAGATGVTTTTAATPDDDGQWTMAGKDWANTRFSTLAQINADNVEDLRLAWSYQTGLVRGHEAAPLVVGETMYVVMPFPNELYAFDLKNPGSPPRPKWTYAPAPAAAAQGVACCDTVNRGAIYWDGKIIYDTLDVQTVAVDAITGKEVWRTKLGDVRKGETMTMAPLVVPSKSGAKVLVGNSGGEMGVRGWLTALDAATGAVAWRAYSTGPDSDVRIGPDFRPHYAQDVGKDLGVATWPPGAWEVGGGTVWGFVSYDPELDLLFYGTSNPAPWNAEARPGDDKWTSGVFARHPDDGRAAWFYQWSPHDAFGYDGINENVLVDMTIGGKARKVLLHADQNGYFYVLDRATGEVLDATPFAHVTTTTGIDTKTGLPKRVVQYTPRVGKVVRDICPASAGAKSWQPMSFSPKTGLAYVPHQNLCQDQEAVEANYIAGTPYVGANVRMKPGPGGHRGELTAWDPVHAKAAWKILESFPVWSGTVATAGDVVFYGTMDGWFKAVHARTGEVLWKFKTESGVVGQPVTYRGPDGKQYVAVLDGVGGWAGALVSVDLDARDKSAARGFAAAMTDLKAATKKGGGLYVFALP